MTSGQDTFYDSSDWESNESLENEQPTTEQPAFDPSIVTQLQQQNQQLQQQVGQIQNWFQQNPYAPATSDPKQEQAVSALNDWAKQQGFMTQQEYLQQQEIGNAEQVAKSAGFPGFETAYSYYNAVIGMATANGQKQAESQQVINLANQGRWSDAVNLAVKYFGKPQQGIPSLNFNTNHTPDNSQQMNQGNYYGSEQYQQDRFSTDPAKRFRAQRALDASLKAELRFNE
jgi:hypothetical protein